MLIEIRHLRSLLAIQETGSLAAAARRLHLTQSALSHQMRAVEEYFGTPLLLRGRRPARLSPAGERLAALAREVLPRVEAAEGELRAMGQGEAGRLHVTIECHACFDWLLPLLDRFRVRWPGVEVDIRLGRSFEALPALAAGEVDLVITSDPVPSPELAFAPLFGFEGRLAVAPDHPLAGRAFVTPADLAGEVLITYPVERARLDVFRHFLDPAGVEPAAVRQAELTAVILQLVSHGRGVAALPDWVLREAETAGRIRTLALGDDGLRGTVHAGVREAERHRAYMDDFIHMARESGPVPA